MGELGKLNKLPMLGRAQHKKIGYFVSQQNVAATAYPVSATDRIHLLGDPPTFAA
jgi:hypothetical protein